MNRVRQGKTKAKRRTKVRVNQVAQVNEGHQEQSASASRGRPLSRYLGKNKPYRVTVPVLAEKVKPERPSSVDASPGEFFSDAMSGSGGW